MKFNLARARLFSIASLASIALLGAGCGQKGPLHLPDKPAAATSPTKDSSASQPVPASR